MIGKLISAGIKLTTLPVDIASITLDVASGGDGSKESRQSSGANPLEALADLRDEVADAAKSVDS